MTMQGHELKALREALGWGQRKFADEIGMTQSFVGQMERGERPIEKRTALAAKAIHHLNSTYRMDLPTIEGLPTTADLEAWDAIFDGTVPGGNSARLIGVEITPDGHLFAICRLKRKEIL